MATQEDLRSNDSLHKLYSMPYHHWLRSEDVNNFPVQPRCDSQGIIMFSDHVPNTCPGEKVQRQGEYVCVYPHGKEEGVTDYGYYVATGSNLSPGDEEISLHLCSHTPPVLMYVSHGGNTISKTYKVQMIECTSSNIIGTFEYKSRHRKGRSEFNRFRHSALSPDCTVLCTLVQFKCQRSVLWSDSVYEALIYKKTDASTEMALQHKVTNIGHVHREGPVALIPPGFLNQKLFLLNIKSTEPDNQQDRLVVDFNLNTGEVEKACSFDDIPIMSNMDWENWVIQSVSCNRVGTVMGVACEVTSSHTMHDCRVFVFCTLTLNLLQSFDFMTPVTVPQKQGHLRLKGCCSNITPVFSDCSTKMAIMSNNNSDPDLLIEDSATLNMSVYQLKRAESLAGLCREVILKNMKQMTDIACLPLPQAILEYLSCY